MKEFDKGDAGLARFLLAMKNEAASNETSCSKLPAILGANILPRIDSTLLAEEVPSIDKHAIYTLSNGGKVGIIGIDVKRKTMESSQPDEGTILLDEKEVTKEQVAQLTQQGINKIVVLTHIGYQNDQDWIANIEGVDIVVGGDSHTLLGEFGYTAGPYATVIEKDDGTKTCVVQAWEYSKVVGKLDIDIDEKGNVLSCGGAPFFPLNPDKVEVRDASPRYDLSPSDALLVMDVLSEASNGQVKPTVEDLDAAQDLLVFSSQASELSKKVVTQASEFIPLEAGGFESGACDLVAQGFLLNPLSSADISIQNRGGCRSNIEEGNFTVEDAYELLLFSNTMVNLKMTGTQIKNVLEDAIDFYLDPTGSWGAYPRASGLRFGERISCIKYTSESKACFLHRMDQY